MASYPQSKCNTILFFRFSPSSSLFFFSKKTNEEKQETQKNKLYCKSFSFCCVLWSFKGGEEQPSSCAAAIRRRHRRSTGHHHHHAFLSSCVRNNTKGKKRKWGINRSGESGGGEWECERRDGRWRVVYKGEICGLLKKGKKELLESFSL